MANRFRLNATDWQPQPGRKAYIDDRPNTVAQARKYRHTVSTGANPFHEGMREAKNSGVDASRRVALGIAKNGVPHQDAVATDHRTRKLEQERERREARFRRLHRKIDPTLA